MKETFKAFDQAKSEGWFIGWILKSFFSKPYCLPRRAHLELRRLHDQAGAKEGCGQQEGDLHQGEATQDVRSCP